VCLTRRGVVARSSAQLSTIDFFIGGIQKSFELPLINDTGLDGSFDWRITRADGARLSDAMEEQLGLKLERRSGQREVFVIESKEMPTPD